MNIKNRKIYKIAIITIFLIGLVFLLNEAFAADLAISVSGNNVSISSQYTGRVNLSASGATLSKSEVWLENGSESVTVNVADKTKGATITATPNNGKMSDSEGNLVNVGAKSFTIQGVKEQQTQPTQQQTQQPTQTQTPAQPAATYTNTNQTLYVKNNGTNVRKEAVNGGVITSLKAGASVQVTGTGSNGWSRVSVNGQTGYIRSDLLTSTKPAEEQKEEEQKNDEQKQEQNTEKSTNKALKDLVVENYKLSPDFTPETTKYSVDVKGDVEKITITPILQDEKSKFVIEGNENLKVGNNIIKITVTAEDGTTRIYTIAVAKTSEENTATEMLKLKDLRVSNANLQPSFSPEITNYVIETDDPSSIKADAVVATAEDSNVEVTVSESQDTDKNEKIITVMLEDKEGTRTGVYQITVKKASQNPIEAIKNVKDNKLYIILGSIIGVLIILIIVIIILLKKTSNSEDDDDFENDDELSDDYDYSLKNAIDEANTEPEQQYDDIVENSNVKSQILNSTPTEYDVFRDNDDIGKTQVFGDLDPENKTKRKGKHF